MYKFEKVPTGIFNKVEENKRVFLNKFIDNLEELFPETVKDGVVDFQALLDRFGEYEEASREKYNMTWIGKSKAIQEANEDIFGRTLKYVPEESKNPETTANIYIEGDNLEVLKLLRQSYYGKIKMIYIDPPYNTGNDFVYKDNFTMKKEEYDKISGGINQNGERLFKNTKDHGRYHSNWLNMMYPRLKVAKDLLKDDGVILISIDDNEVENLKKICNEIFGERNFIGEIIRKTKSMTGDDGNGFNLQHENLFIYAKNKLYTYLLGNEKDFENYSNPDNDPLGDWCSGDPSAKSGGETTNFPIKNPFTNKVDYPPNGRYWAFSESTLAEYIKKGKIKFKTDYRQGERGFIFKRYKNEVKSMNNPVNSLFATENKFMNQSATIELKNLFEDSVFSYPKPTDFLQELVKYCTTNKGDIILDFFSGSATTAQAVMQLNAEGNGKRKYIMVQLPELVDEKDTAFNEGYKNIAEIGKERIRRAGEIIKKENKDAEGIENLDIGFKVFKTEDTNLKMIRDTISEGLSIEEHKALSKKDRIDFNPHFTDIDVVYEMILRRQDIDLSEEIDLRDHIGDRTYLIGHTVLVCLEEVITEEMVTKIGEIGTDLSWIIMRDSAFEDNINLKLNTVNLLKSVVKENHNKEQKIYWI